MIIVVDREEQGARNRHYQQNMHILFTLGESENKKSEYLDRYTYESFQHY